MRLSALLQLNLHSRPNTWLQLIGQRQLQYQDENHLSFGIWHGLYWRFCGIFYGCIASIMCHIIRSMKTRRTVLTANSEGSYTQMKKWFIASCSTGIHFVTYHRKIQNISCILASSGSGLLNWAIMGVFNGKFWTLGVNNNKLVLWPYVIWICVESLKGLLLIRVLQQCQNNMTSPYLSR